MKTSIFSTSNVWIALLRTARPRQWVKNASMFAALFFSGLMLEDGYFKTVLEGFVVFCLISSSIYILNDLVDVEKDRLHPYKKKRPIASGLLPVPVAVFATIAGLLVGLSLSFFISRFFFVMVLAYVLLQISYSWWLKHQPILDVFSIATGFVLRIYAGALVVNLHMNVWFLLTVVSLSLFLAVGKRQSERTLLEGVNQSLTGHRSTLLRYTPRLLDIYTGMFANATWLSYSIFSFNFQQVKPSGFLLTLYTIFPRTFNSEKLLMITIPLVIYGVMRYLQLVYEQNKGESPERVLLSDVPLLSAVVTWVLVVFVIIYWLA